MEVAPTIEIVVPQHEASQLASLSPLLPSEAEIYVLYVQKSRVLWSSLYPLLHSSSPQTIAQRAAQLLLEQPYCIRYSFSDCKIQEKTRRSEREPGGTDEDVGDQMNGFYHRTVETLHDTCTERTRTSTILLLLPPNSSSTPLQYAFSTRLNTLEHRLVRASSISHYMATLGGGFFFCRHYTTAAQLALHQHAVAQHVLQDPRLAATCWIHLAYNCAYRGQFVVAEQILQHVHTELGGGESNKNNGEQEDPLQTMCASAALLCQRMRHSHPVLSAASSMGDSAPTVDDYLRIRVLQDQSSKGGGVEVVTSLIDTTHKELYQRQQ